MKIACSKSITHAPCTPNTTTMSEPEIEKAVQHLLQDTGISQQSGKRSADGTLVLPTNQSQKLHTLLLKAEKMGLNIRYTKQTLIEIC